MKRALILVVGLMVARTASAQPAASAQAEVLFKQGKDLMAKKQFAEACAAFAASVKLDYAMSTVLNEADCREKTDQIATAWGLFVEVEHKTTGATDATNLAYHAAAHKRAAKLEPLVSKLTVTVAKTPGVVVTRNGEVIDAAAWGLALPLDGGSYTIVAKAPGRVEWKQVVALDKQSDAKTVEVPLLDDRTKPVVAVVEPPAKPLVPAAPLHQYEPVSRNPAIIATVGAVALVGSAVVLEVLAQQTYDDAKAEPDDAKQTSQWESANHKRYAAEGFGVAGLAVGGVAVWLFMRHPQTREMVTVVPTTNGLGVVGRF